MRLGDKVYAAIYEQLMSHKILPGDRMSIDNLVRELGVSQTPIREALSRLEAQGLVVKRHLIGYSAAPQLDRAGFEELFEMRMLLEPFAAARAARTASDEALQRLETIDRDLESPKAAAQGGVAATFARLDAEFHDLIALLSGNALLRNALGSLNTHIHLFRLFHHSQATADSVLEHRAIIDAMRRHDEKGADEAMRSHIESSRARLVSYFG